MRKETMRALSEIAVYQKADMAAPQRGKGRVAQVFFNVNMAKQHNGMSLLAKEYGVDLETLVPGQYVAFLNRARTKVKLFTAGNLFAYLALPDNGEVSIEVLMQIPKIFGGPGAMDYQPVLEAAFAVSPEDAALDKERFLQRRLPRGRSR